MAGQSINDRLTAARYSLAGQGLAKSVCKATTEEVIGPKKKHLDYLLHCTNEPNVSIPQLANLLIERAQMQSWVIVFKALITVHHLMCYGNERFTQYLASSNCNFNLGGFLDKTGVASHPQINYDMSTFIRRYAKYINEKAISYRGVAFDFCKVKRGKEDGTLRTMPTDQLLKTLPVLQAQVDALLDFDCTDNALTNGVINSAFMLLFRDLIRLFACYNDGIINLLEKYFEMNKKQARDALDCYKKFLIRMDRVAEFLKVAESVGIEKSDIPDLTKAPSSLLDALEAHLASLEGKKPPTTTSTTSSNGRLGEPAATTNNGTGVDELTKRAALAEEEALYEKLKVKAEHDHAKNNPFLSSPTNEAAPAAPTNNGDASQIIDLFGASQTDAAPGQAGKASDDLLQLGNPFADMLSGTAAATTAAAPAQPYTNGVSQSVCQTSSTAPGFVSDNAFDAVFGKSSTSQSTVATSSFTWPAFDGFGDIEVQPVGGGRRRGGRPSKAMTVFEGQSDDYLSTDSDTDLSESEDENMSASEGSISSSEEAFVTSRKKSKAERDTEMEDKVYDRESRSGSTPPKVLFNKVSEDSPRTRSRGRVKINLWTLDVNPVLPGERPVPFSRKQLANLRGQGLAIPGYEGSDSPCHSEDRSRNNSGQTMNGELEGEGEGEDMEVDVVGDSGDSSNIDGTGNEANGRGEPIEDVAGSLKASGPTQITVHNGVGL